MEKFKLSSPEKQQNIQEIIAYLEGQDIKLGLQSKILTLLTYAGVKPTSIISWNGQNIPESQVRVRTAQEEQEIQSIKDMLTSLGLSFDTLEKVMKISEHEHRRQTTFSISLDEEKVKDVIKWLKDPCASDGEHIDHVNIGQLLGFPETSIEAFNNKESSTSKDLPVEIKNTELGKFILGTALFAFSKKYLQQELELYDVWMHTIKDLSPKLYEEVIRKGELKMLK